MEKTETLKQKQISTSPKNNYQRGIVSIVLSALGFAAMAFFVKQAGSLPVMQKAIFRNIIAGIAAYIMLKKAGGRIELAPENRWTMFFRCLFGTIGIICNFFVLDYLNLGDASMLQKMSPFFAIIMSYFILQEKVDKLAIFSVLLALIGAAFVVKPTKGLVSLPALIGLVGGFCAGSAYTFVRKLGVSGVKGPLIIFGFSASSVLAMTPFVLVQYKPMSIRQFLCLLMAGFSGVIGQVFVTKAYTYAPAKEISVFDYTQVLFAVLLGFVFLGELPDVYSLIGYVIIIGAAIFKWYFSRKQTESS